MGILASISHFIASAISFSSICGIEIKRKKDFDSESAIRTFLFFIFLGRAFLKASSTNLKSLPLSTISPSRTIPSGT